MASRNEFRSSSGVPKRSPGAKRARADAPRRAKLKATPKPTERPRSTPEGDLARTLLDSLPAHIAVLDEDGRILQVNEPWLRFGSQARGGGVNRAGVGASYLEACRGPGADEYAEKALRGIEAVLRGQTERFALEYPCHSPAEQRWFLMTVTRPPKSVGGALVVHTDITEQRRGEQALQQAEEKRRRSEDDLDAALQRYEQQVRLFEGVASTTPDFVYVFDVSGRFLYANRRLLEVWGLKLEDAVGRTCRELGYEQWHHDMHMREIAQVISTKRPIKGEVPFKAPLTGIFGIYEYIFTPVIGPTGNVQLIAGTTRDVTDRKQVELALRDSEEQFRAMFNISSVGKAQADPTTGRILRANTGLCRMLGYTEAELLTRTVRDITHPEDRDSDWQAFSRMARGEAPAYESEKRYLRADGEVIWAHVSANLIRDAAGQPLRTTAVIHDITDAKRAETALQRSRDRLELLSRTVSVLLTADDPQNIVEQLCNDVRSFLECDVFFNFLLDNSARRLRLNACGGIAPPLAQRVETLDLGESLCGTVAREGRRMIVEHLQTNEDPRAALVRGLGIRAYACHPLFGKGSQVLGTLSFGTRNRDQFSAEDLDLMRTIANHVAVAMLRRNTEMALRDSEEQFRALADSIPNLAWWANADGYITWYNRRWYEYTGTTHDQMEGWGWQSVHHAETLPRVMQQWTASIATGQPFEMEFPLRGADGQFRWFLTRIVPMRGASGEVLRWFGTNTDVSEIREARMILARSKHELQELVAERTASLRDMVAELEHFSYSITHDMRAPLRAMQGFAEITGEALAEGRREEAEEFLRRIRVSAERMDCLITDALNYSKAVRSELPSGPVDVARLLRGMLDTYPEFQGRKGDIRLARDIPMVIGNEAGLTQCFSNLLGNALKFARPGSPATVRVWGELREDWVRLWVEDDGVGISESLLPRVFEMFSRGSHPEAGTGIGLALVRKVVDRMGGRVGVESQPGKGSRFWIDLKPGDRRVTAAEI